MFAAQHSIYAFADPGHVGLVKIGKDQKWPQRLRQARSHTPRPIEEVGRWVLATTTGSETHKAEQEAAALLERHRTDRAREWFRVNPTVALEKLSRMFGAPVLTTPLDNLKPYDDWRDYVQPRCSHKPRRIWVGIENFTSRIKIVHSPKTVEFRTISPTYSCSGVRWQRAWEWPDGLWSPQLDVHPLDQKMIDLWSATVTRLGYGLRDGRVGWLQEGVSIHSIESSFENAGLKRCPTISTWLGLPT